MEELEEALNSSFFEDSDVDGDSEQSESSPSSSRKRKRTSTKVKIPVGTCNRCNRKYFALDGYKKHMGKHIFEELQQLFAPTEDAFKRKVLVCSIEVLKKMDEKPVLTGKGPEISKVIQVLLNPDNTKPLLVANVQTFFDAVADELWKCIPAPKVQSTGEFHSKYVAAIVALLSKNRGVLIECLENCVIVPPAVLQCLLCAFINPLSICVEAAFIKAVRTPHLGNVYSESGSDNRDNLANCEIQQTVHYIGGAAVKSVLSKATRASKSQNWNNIASVIQKRILVGDMVEAPADVLCEWTESQNRGGLKFIGNNMFVFFMALCEILKVSEKDNGSLFHSDVQEQVKSSYLMSLLWDELIQGSLKEDENELLKSELVRLFTNTWGRGIAQRRLNAIVNTGDDAALRSKLSK